MSRVLTPGGHLLVLDFSMPGPPLRAPYRFYLHRILPSIAGIVTRERSAYQYLGASIEQFPAGPSMCALIAENGFHTPVSLPQSAGIVSIYTATKSL